MNDHTQDGQREKWLYLAQKTIDAINAIDDDTPAKPTMEPNWWVQMIDVRRGLYDAIAASAVRTRPARRQEATQ